MLKSAIEKIEQLCKPMILEKDGHTYVVGTDGKYEEVSHDLTFPACIDLDSLDALVMMIKAEWVAGHKGQLHVTIPSHTKVRCFGVPDPESRMAREYPYIAVATDVPGWEASVNMGFEEAMIALRTRFQPTPDLEYAIRLLSDMTTGSKVVFNDNGIATSIVTKTGVALQTNAPIRPIITLRPYRTFQEVEQPASQFLIRVSERGIRFVEADGGMWKLAARRTVKDYLTEKLAKEIEGGLVFVAM